MAVSPVKAFSLFSASSSIVIIGATVGTASSPVIEEPEIIKHSVEVVPPPVVVSQVQLEEFKEVKQDNVEAIPVVESFENEEARKEKIRAEAKEAIRKMNDYSFRMWSPCSVGTGWILDYVVPEDSNKYPTTWYIATNAHVVQYYKFADNSYEQELPFPKEKTNELRKWMPWNVRNSELNTGLACRETARYAFQEFNMSQQDTGEELQSHKGGIYRNWMKEPKLFYLPIDFLDKNEKNAGFQLKDNYYRDFAVLEIEFTNEDYARKITNNFADKYTVESLDAINVFAEPLESKYSWEEIENLDENFYSLAYPVMGKDKYRYTTNFNESDVTASTLARDWYNLTGHKKINGYVDADKMEERFPDLKTNWNFKKLNDMGHFYLIKKNALSAGSSGGLYIDGKGDLLGIKRLYDENFTQHSWIVPLRSKEVVKDGVIKTPAYDLIKGGIEGQRTSYRQQVEKYGKNTWLKKRGWEHKARKIN